MNEGEAGMKEKEMQLDCGQFEVLLPDLDRAGTRGPALREAALSHAETCGRCAARLTESESLDFALRSLAAHDAFRMAPPRVETALINRFRLEKGIVARRRLRWELSVLGAAAAMLLVLGLTFHERRLPPAEPKAQLASAAQPGATGVDATDDSAGATYDDAGEFTPLPYADDPDADGGAVVRVVLSRAALVSLGVQADAFDASDNISVDLAISQDGTPQAIRLLSPENQNEN